MKQITYKEENVVTTTMLAEQLGTSDAQLTKNFNNNKSRYTEGLHYHLLTGSKLRTYKRDIQNLDVAKIPSNANQLYLWTEKGAFNHVKSLGTDEAWDAFQNLVNTYFRVREIADNHADDSNTLNFKKHIYRPVQIENSKAVNHYNFGIGGIERTKEYNQKNCYEHTGKFPNELKREAKEAGVPSKNRSSGKEVVRYYNPGKAASMSLTDELCKRGTIGVTEAANLCKPAIPLFDEMIRQGLITQ
jgi:hypothetical protein